MAAPGVSVYGPATTTTTSGMRWLTQIGAAARMFAAITGHVYPIGNCPEVPPPNPQPIAVELLSPEVRQWEDEVLQTLALAGSIAGRPTRIGETNSIGCSMKADDASPGFAGALWSLDWVLRAENSGVRGLNFNGEFRSCEWDPYSPICAPGDTEAADAGDVTAQPVYYGLLAARQLEGGRFVPTSMNTSGPLPNLTTWATVVPGGTVRLAIHNMATTGVGPAGLHLYRRVCVRHGGDAERSVYRSEQ